MAHPALSMRCWTASVRSRSHAEPTPSRSFRRRWLGSLARHVEQVDEPGRRLLAAFDWVAAWCAEPGFRGCAWINAFGELGSTCEPVLDEVRAHKRAFHRLLGGWAAAAGVTPEPVCLLAEGAVVTAAITADPEPALQARAAVAALLRAAGQRPADIGTGSGTPPPSGIRAVKGPVGRGDQP